MYTPCHVPSKNFPLDTKSINEFENRDSCKYANKEELRIFPPNSCTIFGIAVSKSLRTYCVLTRKMCSFLYDVSDCTITYSRIGIFINGERPRESAGSQQYHNSRLDIFYFRTNSFVQLICNKSKLCFCVNREAFDHVMRIS